MKYIGSYSKSFGTGTNYQSLYDTGATGNNLELTATLKSSGNKAFGLLFSKNGSSTSYILREGATGGGVLHCTLNNGSDSTTTSSNYSANTEFTVKLKIKSDNTYEAYIDNSLVKSGTDNVVGQLRYIELMSWATASHTVTLTDLKLKQL